MGGGGGGVRDDEGEDVVRIQSGYKSFCGLKS